MRPPVALMHSRSTDPDRLHEVFHDNTKHVWSQNQEIGERIARYLYTERCIRESACNRKVYRLLPRIDLPPAQPLDLPVSTALARRISMRRFQPVPLNLQAVANLLQPALAANRQAQSTRVPDAVLHFRPYPSGGGLYPVEVYPVLLRVDGAPCAITHYDPIHHRLSVLRQFDDLAAFSGAWLGASDMVHTAALGVVFTSVFERSVVKYGDRGYRLCLLEAGHAAQNLCLTAVAQGLDTLAYGGYHDDALAGWLGVDGLDEAVVHAVFCGTAQADDTPPPATTPGADLA